ncbi:hypothetical protein ACU4GD_01290 [Cupriavidus basilensis]
MMVLALSILLLGQRLTAGAVAGSLLSIAGVLVVVSSGEPPRPDGQRRQPGGRTDAAGDAGLRGLRHPA